jgi:hypothetical protein
VSVSRLDRFLLSESWIFGWLNYIQAALPRGLFDHCSILLTIDKENRAPRPQRMFKCWANLPIYKEYAKEQWLSYQVFGWSWYVLKEKFKLLKGSLQSCRRDHTKNLDSKICGAKDCMSALDIKAEGEGLEDEEVE